MSNWFPKLYNPLMKPLEKIGFGNIRKELLLNAKGQVLEIGSGTGFNFSYYKHADKVVAVEPATQMREQSFIQIKKASVPIEVISASGEKLPFADNSFDTVVGTLVLCTIPNPEQALKEMRRVCKPNGKILLFEHVRLENKFLGSLQDWLTPFWKHICDGCHLNRNTLQLIEQTGLQVDMIEKHYKKIFLVMEASIKSNNPERRSEIENI
ncbi:class I SAM-dependent methyltransferase [Salipaludibacillus sp. CF4.18]|uniref:class I SAM-dependent methyltransferase n=1 Tax=Salipaludibacillus sp. CF4.18 TaxID=3373081 RepID=UPI003EE764FE